MKGFYITTSIPYVNASPHIGHVFDPLMADVLARYHQIKGQEARFLVGADEHGAKIVRAAEKQGKTPQQLVDENSEEFKNLKEILNLSWNDFIRTSDQKRHWPGAQKMWKALSAADDIYWKKYRGLYCVGHEAFITEKDLVNGKCRDHQQEPEIMEEENWFFRLSKYSQQIKEALIKGRPEVVPEHYKKEILSFIDEGLEDVSVSRPYKDLSWGVPVPDDPSQTMYVWLEALTSYISSIGYGQEDSESAALFHKWWPADVQVIGKDNLRFHAAIWPGMLLSAGLELPKTILVHGFVNVESQKISKTIGNIISPQELVKKYGIDSVRYYFLRELPFYNDSDFSYKKFEGRYNGDLANGLGNFAARVLALAEKKELKIKQEFDEMVKKEIKKTKELIEQKFGEFKFHEALGVIWNLISFGDRYVNEKKPWQTGDAAIIFGLVVILDNVAAMLASFLPQTAEKITSSIIWTDDILKIKRPEILFPRLK